LDVEKELHPGLLLLMTYDIQQVLTNPLSLGPGENILPILAIQG
jgi:hypothetical protein